MIVVYSALFGDRDLLWSVPPLVGQKASYVLFTESPRREVGLWTVGANNLGRPAHVLRGTENLSPIVPTWEQRSVELLSEGPRMTARYFKIMAHEAFPDVKYSIWVDANVRLLLSPSIAIRRWLSTKDLAVFAYPEHECLYQEVADCISSGRGNKRRLLAQVAAYQRAGMPRKWGLASTRCVIRRHTSEVAALNEAWWDEVKTHSVRDQVSLPYVCWKRGFRWGDIPEEGAYSRHFWFIRH